MDGTSLATTATDLSTTVGPVTIAADMFDEVSAATTAPLLVVVSRWTYEKTDTSVTVSLDVPIGDATIGLDNSGNVISIWYILWCYNLTLSR